MSAYALADAAQNAEGLADMVDRNVDAALAERGARPAPIAG
jgi:hypothetical protein